MLSITSIKNMSPRDRKKILHEDLIKLILSLDDNADTTDKNDKDLDIINDTIKEMMITMNIVKDEGRKNSADIINLQNHSIGIRDEIKELRDMIVNPAIPKNEEIHNELNNLRNMIKNTTPNINNNNNIDFYAQTNELRDLISNIQIEVEEIQQYLRVNNIEIVGLPPENTDDENEQYDTENLLLDLFNNDMGVKIAHEDIDISHIVPSRRNDGKQVVVCRFVSRKHKFQILNRRKNMNEVKFRNSNLIYINEHLSPKNREIFALASQKRKDDQYKYLWTRNGTTFMRKTDTSEIFTIRNKNSLDDL